MTPVSDLPTSDIERNIANCATCGASFMAASAVILGTRIWVRNCQPCIDRHEEHLRSMQETPRVVVDRWAMLCPREYRLTSEGGETDMDRLTRECPALPQIMGWKYGPTGMLLHGPTGRCKTRALWRVLRQCYDANKGILALTAGQFGREYAEAGGNHTLNDWFKALSLVDVLMIDEIGNAAWTEGAEATFFDLLEKRGTHGLPILTATNHDSASLESKLRDQVRSKPLIRRLRAYCQSISLP